MKTWSEIITLFKSWNMWWFYNLFYIFSWNGRTDKKWFSCDCYYICYCKYSCWRFGCNAAIVSVEITKDKGKGFLFLAWIFIPCLLYCSSSYFEAGVFKSWIASAFFIAKCIYITIKSVPTLIKINPIIDFAVNCSCKNIAAKTIVITTLNLSIGTTTDTLPSFNAL